MQSITSVANPLYGVSTLTSSASSTVRRSRVAIPVNQEGVYGNRTSDTRYTAECTLGSNQDGIISANTFWEFDITPTWWDQGSSRTGATTESGILADNLNQILTPTFDQSVSSLIARMKISLPQGLVIEEIPMYNQLCNIVDMHTVDPIKKTQDVVSLSSYSKNIFRDRGQNQYMDGTYYQSPTFANSLRHGKTTRIQIPLKGSSFMKAVRYIPLQLLRNGLKFEIEFEDPYRAFVLENSRSTDSWKQSNIPNGAHFGADLGVQKAYPAKANFAFGPGPLSASGGTNTRDIVAPVLNTWVGADYSWPWYFDTSDVTNAVQPFAAPGLYNTNAQRPFVNDTLRLCKNFMYLSEEVAQPMVQLRNELGNAFTRSYASHAGINDLDALVLCVPIVLKRDGVPVHRFFTSMSLTTDGYSWSSTVSPAAGGASGSAIPFTNAIVPGTNVTANSTQVRAPFFSTVYNAAGVGTGGFYFRFSRGNLIAHVANATTLPDTDHVFTQSLQSEANQAANPFIKVGNSSQTAHHLLMGTHLADADFAVGSNVMLAFPCYKYNHFSSEADGAFGETPIFPIADAAANRIFQSEFFKSNYTLDIGVEEAFLLNLTNKTKAIASAIATILQVSKLSSPSLYDPIVHDLQHVINVGRHYMNWNYTIRNIRMIADMCQPSSDVFSEFSRAFQSRIGIPYTMTRMITVDRTFDAGTSGSQQFVIPISARSLKSILITFDDPYFQTFSRGSLGAMYTPFLSSFMRRGLVTLTLTIGGATKPEYVLRFDRNGGVEHFIETGSAFGIPYISGFQGQLTKDGLAPTRNYFASSNFDIPISTLLTNYAARVNPPATLTNVEPNPKYLGVDYIDTSKFVVAIPLARTDQYGFASGLDSTMSGSLVLTATFEQDGAPTQTGENYDPGKIWQRQIHMTVRGDVDAVLTFQNDLSTIRW